MKQFFQTPHIFGATFVSVCALSMSAQASSWTINPAATNSSNEAISATASDKASISFLCLNGKLRAAVSTSGIEGSDILSTNAESRRRISRDVTIQIDGKSNHTSEWRINPRAEIMVTPTRKEAVALYKAAATGKKISVQRKGKQKFDFVLPKPTDEFMAFGGACGVGSNAKKQS